MINIKWNLSSIVLLLFLILILLSHISLSAPGATNNRALNRNYTFSGSISREVLESYLSRAITMSDMFMGEGNLDDNIRMLIYIEGKFVGRTVFLWAEENQLPNRLMEAQSGIASVHAIDSEIILQAAIFEIITTDVENLPIPAWVFQEFGLTVESRNFDYESMLFDSGEEIDFYGPGASVPDITKLETRLWFFYLAASYIDIGIEAIHLGQLNWVSQADTGYANLEDLIAHIRSYASQNAHRNYVILDAHTHGIVRDGNLLLDFHSYPLRMVEVEGSPMETTLQVGYYDSIYLNSAGGTAPSGWYADSLPYLVEFDHGYGRGTVEENVAPEFVWGYDEISWFSLLSESARNNFLYFAWDWVRNTDPNGYLEMPGMRPTFINTLPHSPDWYFANTASSAVPDGYNQEETIKDIWAQDTTTTTTTADSTTTSTVTNSTTTTNGGPCLSELVYGEYSEETELLRYVRDNVLRQTPEGNELIGLYYQWSPAIVKVMKGDEEFKESVKELIDGILPTIREVVE